MLFTFHYGVGIATRYFVCILYRYIYEDGDDERANESQVLLGCLLPAAP